METSVLDDETLTRLRAEAAATASPFVDPALLREAESLMHLTTDEWLARVLGHKVHRYPGLAAWRYMTNDEITLTVSAIRTDLVHLRALRDERAAERQRIAQAQIEESKRLAQAERDAWQTLRGRLPVPVAVWHNWTARHLDGYEQGADHIVVLEDLTVGRFSREARHPLCWTPSRAHPLRHVTPNVEAEDAKRLPDCKACLRHAERLAGS